MTTLRALSLMLIPTLLALSSCDLHLEKWENRLGQKGEASSSTPTAPERVSPSAPSELLQNQIADVAARVMPSVVSVYSERSVAERGQPTFGPFGMDPFSPFSPQQRAPRGGRERSLGSGVIISADGVIITNHHVVAHAETIRVALKDGRELKAKLVGADPKSDLAVVRVDAQGLPPIDIADSSRTRVGEVVLAVGNPFGIGQTVTMGIISATGRANVGITDYEDFIQTDAAINPGNSGGALVDMSGRLVGINTAIVSGSGGFQGIGFAIPSNMAMHIKDAILRDGRVVRGWLGVGIQDLTEDLAKSLGIAQESGGVLVSDVDADGPAHEAGLKRGDVVIAADGQPVKDASHLRNLIALAGKGKRVQLDVMRDGARRNITVTLGELPDDDDDALARRQSGADEDEGDEAGDEGSLLAGLRLAPLDARARRVLGVPREVSGVVVLRVSPESPAAGALRPGDVVIEVNRTPTPNIDTFRDAASDADERALVLIYREGATVFVPLTRGE